MSNIRSPKKLIEVALPLDDINVASAREKSIRHGHPSTLHLWWARRPLAAARAVIFAQMVNDPGGERGYYAGKTRAQADAEREELFHILRDYARQLREHGSPHLPLIPGLLAEAEGLEAAIGPVTMVLGHNDLLPGNILKGVDRLWLIDWEYAGLGSPLFDLGGLASNNGFTEAQERLLLSAYHDAPADDALWHRYQAMKCASLLRETMWSMVSEIISDLDVDFATYTADNLSAYRAALAALNA